MPRQPHPEFAGLKFHGGTNLWRYGASAYGTRAQDVIYVSICYLASSTSRRQGVKPKYKMKYFPSLNYHDNGVFKYSNVFKSVT